MEVDVLIPVVSTGLEAYRAPETIKNAELSDPTDHSYEYGEKTLSSRTDWCLGSGRSISSGKRRI